MIDEAREGCPTFLLYSASSPVLLTLKRGHIARNVPGTKVHVNIQLDEETGIRLCGYIVEAVPGTRTHVHMQLDKETWICFSGYVVKDVPGIRGCS